MSANQLRGRDRRTNLVIRLEGDAVTQSEPTARVDERQRVTAALNELGRRDQEALLAWAWYDLTAEQAAHALGCTRTAYSVRLHRARRRLVRRLAEHQSTYDPARFAREEP
ncbi:MAG: sigma factor-like helix-turn-helix DNA-binding protein [Streptosporangiales bacterium]